MTLLLFLLLLGALSGWSYERGVRQSVEASYNEREAECQKWSERYWRLFLLFSEKKQNTEKT